MVTEPHSLPNLIFVINDRVGGVAYMNHQIIEYGRLMEYFHVRVLLIRKKEDPNARFSEAFKAHQTDFFDYSEYDNHFYTLKKLHKELVKEIGIIVVNDGMELEALKLFGSNRLTVYSIVHDFYNLKLAFEYYKQVDGFICHTEVYTRALRSAGTDRPKVEYLPHGIKIDRDRPAIKGRDSDSLNLLFIGRFVETKGVQSLYEIEQGLVARNIKADWTLIGTGHLEPSLKKQWEGKTNIRFLAPSSNEQVMEIARENDIFISPSVFEGYGIALLEAMSCGLVPLVYDLPIGIPSILPTKVGFRMEKNNINGFVENIALLNNDRKLLDSMKEEAYQFVAKDYDIVDTSKQYLEAFLRAQNGSGQGLSKTRVKETKTFGLFDKWFVPNILANSAKKIKERLRN
jgi:glycosyltransferase involved in cell wall biosynthesis